MECSRVPYGTWSRLRKDSAQGDLPDCRKETDLSAHVPLFVPVCGSLHFGPCSVLARMTFRPSTGQFENWPESSSVFRCSTVSIKTEDGLQHLRLQSLVLLRYPSSPFYCFVVGVFPLTSPTSLHEPNSEHAGPTHLRVAQALCLQRLCGVRCTNQLSLSAFIHGVRSLLTRKTVSSWTFGFSQFDRVQTVGQTT